MKSFVIVLTRALALLGAAVLVLDVIGWIRVPDGGMRRWIHPIVAYAFATLQLVPVAGLRFPRGPDAPWAPSTKWTWALWLTVSIPILLLGALVGMMCVG